MIYIEAPEIYDPDSKELRSLFLAGGITDCPDWQQEFVEMLQLQGTTLMILNPRRKNFPIGDPNAVVAQIEWEYMHLGKAHMI